METSEDAGAGYQGIKMKPKMHTAKDKELNAILALIQTSFSYMDGRIDPPSSMKDLTVSVIAENCVTGEVWSLGYPVVACMFLKPEDDGLYIGKLAVCQSQRGRGLARRMVELANERAKLQGKSYLELFTRIELIENHLAFNKLGFKTLKEASHPGYEKTTYLIMRRPVGA